MNIIHTDLKPENILFVNSDYEKIFYFPKNIKFNNGNNLFYCNIKDTDIRIIDFGSAIKLDKNKNSYGIINTRQYRAPEVILQCCPLNEKSDIWSIGCILYELYTGDLLFPTHNNEEQLSTYQIVTRSRAKKMKNINEEMPVERQNSQDNNIFVALEPKIDNQEENKESKKKERKQKTKNSNNNKKKRQNKENSIFQNELNNNHRHFG